MLSRPLILDQVVVDAQGIQKTVNDPLIGDMVARQIEEANLLVLNKTDTLTAHEEQSVRNWLFAKVPDTPVFSTIFSKVPVEALFLESGQSELLMPKPISAHDVDMDHSRYFRSL